jgi:hypothetical protein
LIGDDVQMVGVDDHIEEKEVGAAITKKKEFMDNADETINIE